MIYPSIALLCLAIVPGSFSNEDIHQFMSLEEVQQVFHTDYNSVPKYEIVKIDLSERLHKRELPAGSKMHIRAFGQDINLWLHPRESILAGEDTPVYYARYSSSKPEGVEYWHRDGLMGMVGRIFEDPRSLASFVIGADDSGRIRVNGFIESKRIAVRPLPSRVAEEYRRRRRSVGDFDDFDLPYHVVFETAEENYPVLPVNATLLRQRAFQYASGKPYTLYPRILVVVEYSMYRDFGRDIYGLLEYLLAFWNGVDLKYRSLEFPSVRFHISGIVLAEDSYATPYIMKHSLGANAFDSQSALTDVGSFSYAVKDTFPLDSYDISVTLVRQDFGLNADAQTLGIAFIGTACHRDDRDNITYAVALVRDNSAFMGVSTAAHELGHLFGARHDAYDGDCVYVDGFLMAFTTWYTKNSSDFSSCSIQEFEKSLKASRLDCLLNRPKSPGKKLPKLMPGRMKNLEEQCRALDMEASCQDESATPDVCVNIHCVDKRGECKKTKTAAIDGTSCGDHDEFCLHMRCVSL